MSAAATATIVESRTLNRSMAHRPLFSSKSDTFSNSANVRMMGAGSTAVVVDPEHATPQPTRKMSMPNALPAHLDASTVLVTETPDMVSRKASRRKMSAPPATHFEFPMGSRKASVTPPSSSRKKSSEIVEETIEETPDSDHVFPPAYTLHHTQSAEKLQFSSRRGTEPVHGSVIRNYEPVQFSNRRSSVDSQSSGESPKTRRLKLPTVLEPRGELIVQKSPSMNTLPTSADGTKNHSIVATHPTTTAYVTPPTHNTTMHSPTNSNPSTSSSFGHKSANILPTPLEPHRVLPIKNIQTIPSNATRDDNLCRPNAQPHESGVSPSSTTNRDHVLPKSAIVAKQTSQGSTRSSTPLGMMSPVPTLDEHDDGSVQVGLVQFINAADRGDVSYNAVSIDISCESYTDLIRAFVAAACPEPGQRWGIASVDVVWEVPISLTTAESGNYRQTPFRGLRGVALSNLLRLMSARGWRDLFVVRYIVG